MTNYREDINKCLLFLYPFFFLYTHFNQIQKSYVKLSVNLGKD